VCLSFDVVGEVPDRRPGFVAAGTRPRGVFPFLAAVSGMPHLPWFERWCRSFYAVFRFRPLFMPLGFFPFPGLSRAGLPSFPYFPCPGQFFAPGGGWVLFANAALLPLGTCPRRELFPAYLKYRPRFAIGRVWRPVHRVFTAGEGASVLRFSFAFRDAAGLFFF